MLSSVEAARLNAARAGDQDEFSGLTEPYRRELLVHCYRILGSLQDAEDVVQETLLRAWRRLDTFQGRAPLRAWLYKIATNACLDVLDKQPRRVLPTALYPASDAHQPLMSPIAEPVWLEPFPDELTDDATQSPEARYAIRESIRLAFLAALQLLPPRQRVVLLMRDVLGWRASEVAELLDLTLPAVNSALHRARVTLAKHYPAGEAIERRPQPVDAQTRLLLERYLSAWEAADLTGLVALLKEDATFLMPPSPSWYRGRDAISDFVAATVFAHGNRAAPMFAGEARGRWRLRPMRANAQPAFAVYQRDDSAGGYRAFCIEVLSLDEDRIVDITSFINPALFPLFGLPDSLSA